MKKNKNVARSTAKFSSNLIIFHSFICRRSIEFSQETATRFYFLFFFCLDVFLSPHSSLNSMPQPMVMGSICCASNSGWHLQQSFPSSLFFSALSPPLASIVIIYVFEFTLAHTIFMQFCMISDTWSATIYTLRVIGVS